MSELVYDNQTALNAIFAYAKEQDEKSMHEDGVSCVYNGPHGNHCYVGALLEGITITGSENSRAITDLAGSNDEVRERLKNCNGQFLSDCQRVHDNANNWGKPGDREKRLQQLKAVAEKWDLTLPGE